MLCVCWNDFLWITFSGDIQENDTSKKDGIENNLPKSSDELKKPAIRAKRKSTAVKGSFW